MKVMMLVIAREEGFVFLDPERAPKDAFTVDLSLAPGVLWRDVEDEDKVVWIEREQGFETHIRVVPRTAIDDWETAFDDASQWPIPVGVICMGVEDYEALLAE